MTDSCQAMRLTQTMGIPAQGVRTYLCVAKMVSCPMGWWWWWKEQQGGNNPICVTLWHGVLECSRPLAAPPPPLPALPVSVCVFTQPALCPTAPTLLRLPASHHPTPPPSTPSTRHFTSLCPPPPCHL